MNRSLPFASVALLFVFVTGCRTTPQPSAIVPPVKTAAPDVTVHFSNAPTTSQLRILHTSDNESDLLGSEEAGKRNGDYDASGGIARAVTLLQALRARATTPSLTLAAGDTFMPAPALRINIDGENAVSTANNLMGYDVSALGNHEFDLGESFLAGMIEHAAFPYVSTTIEIKGGALTKVKLPDAPTAPWLADHPGHLAAAGKLCAGGTLVGEGALRHCTGLTVGIVGVTTESLRSLSNISLNLSVPNDRHQVLSELQNQVDALTAQGVHIIVVLSHLQDIRKEVALLQAGLHGVDVIIGGGGDNRLANPGQRLLAGDTPDPLCTEEENCYPLVRAGSDGHPCLVVATDGQYNYIGNLDVSFDAKGVLTGYDVARSRPWPVDEESLLELRAPPSKAALAFEAKVRQTLAPRMAAVAQTQYFLDGTRESIRNRETNLGDLAADSIAWATAHAVEQAAKTAAKNDGSSAMPLFALRNSGGIRAHIGSVDRETLARQGGPIRLLDIQSALRFDGAVVVVTATHAQLRSTLEAALRGAGTGRGRFPQVSSEVFLQYDEAAPEQRVKSEDGKPLGITCPGLRVRQLTVQLPGQAPLVIVKDGALLSPDVKITFATLAYLAKGGDDWFPLATQSIAIQPVNLDGTPVTEQSAFIAFLKAQIADHGWSGGSRYRDPVPGQPQTFTRIRQITGPQPAQVAGCGPVTAN